MRTHPVFLVGFLWSPKKMLPGQMPTPTFSANSHALEDALRNFRMLLAPHTAMVKNAKQHVRELAAKFDAPKQRFVEIWMAKLEKGQKAEDPSEVLDECLISVSMGGARSRDCFDFEEALRNYKTAAEL